MIMRTSSTKSNMKCCQPQNHRIHEQSTVNIVTIVPEVMDGYLGMLTDDFILVVDISCGEVDHDINDEHYID